MDPSRAVLLVHDMQKYFVSPFSADMRGTLLEHCHQLNQWSKNQEVPVYFTAQPGSMTEQQRGLLKEIWGPGMSAAPEDRELCHEFGPVSPEQILTKWRYSAFFQTDLLDRIRQQGRDQLILCGVYAHVGVLVTAIEAYSNDIETFLVADAVGDFSLRHHRMAMEYAAGRCAVVTTTGEVVQ